MKGGSCSALKRFRAYSLTAVGLVVILVIAAAVIPAFAIEAENTPRQHALTNAMEESANQPVQMEGPASSSAGSLTVRVIDNSSGAPIASANVTLQYPTSRVSSVFTSKLTNQNGYVSFTLFQIYNPVPENSCCVTAMKSGYIPGGTLLTLSPMNETTITISLVSMFPSTSSGNGIVLLAIALPVFLIAPLYVVEKRRRNSASGSVSQTREVVDMHEELGHTNVLFPENYGADMRALSETTISPRTQGSDATLGTCMICHMKVEQGDIEVRCPNCGCVTHKTHMLEWLHVKNYCPVCHRHINEGDLQ